MKSAVFVIVLTVILWGCDNRSAELEKQNTDLQQRNKELTQDLSSRDEYVDNITQSINEVYDNLEAARAQEKSILKEKTDLEAEKKLSRSEIRAKLLTKINAINTGLTDNQKKVTELEGKLTTYKSQFAGLRKMVASLKQTIETREASIAELELKVKGLENDVAEKGKIVTQRDSVITEQHTVIDDQHRQLTTGFYVIGSRDDLEKKGIIKKQGGFLWGLLGSTTTLANGFDTKYFKPINKVDEHTIQVDGKIDDIVPRRNENFYQMKAVGDKQSMITIAEPNSFWQDNYLVIITD